MTGVEILKKYFPINFIIKPQGMIKDVSIMFAGNLGAQLITFLASPFITRLYTPSDFGISSYIFSLVGIISIVACLRYESAIVLPKEDWKVLNLFMICVVSVISISILLFFVIFFKGASLSNFLEKPWLEHWLYFIPIGVLIQGISQSLTFLHTKFKNFIFLSISRAIIATIPAIIKILAGFLVGSTAFWLLTGNFIGPVSGIIFLLVILFKNKKFLLKKNISFKNMLNVAREYSKFPIYSMPTGFLNTASQNIPILLLAHFFSQDVVGYFSLATSIIRRPIIVMSQSLSKVYLQKVAELNSQGKSLRRIMTKTILSLAAIGIIPFGLLTISGQWIFSVVFGKNWAEAGLYAQILSPWLFFLFINSPATQVIIVKQALRFNFFYNLIAIFMRIGSLVLSYYIFPKPWAVILAFSACGIFVNIFYIMYAFCLTKKEIAC